MLRFLGPFPHGAEQGLASERLDPAANDAPALVAIFAVGELGQAVARLVVSDASDVAVSPAEGAGDAAQAAQAVFGGALAAQLLGVKLADRLIEGQRAFF
jgi:hypothetical protein